MASEAVDELTFGLADLRDVRHRVSAAADEVGLPERRVADFALAVSEIATNAIQHGRPPAILRIWRGDGEVTCEVTDRGRGIHDDPEPGRVPPPPDSPGGRGIWLARQLSDHLEIHDGTGCRVLIRAAARPDRHEAELAGRA